MAEKDYSTFIPQVIPKVFNTYESCQMVAIYDEDLSDSPRDLVTLIFPGDQAGSSPKRVVPDRVGTRTLVFRTPEYKNIFTNRNTLEVLPILHHPDGDIELKPFTLTIKDAIKSIIELCVSLANSEAVLPALITLMLHCTGEKNNFQDPQFDRIMSTLVGSRTPGSSISIKDIVLPKKRWRRMDLADLCHEYRLTCTEDQANILKLGRRLPKKSVSKKSRQNQNLQLYENLTPLTDCGLKASRSEPALADPVEGIEDLMAEAKAVYRVEQDVNPSNPSYLSFKVGQEVFVTDTSSPDLWYGVCGDKYGCFDPNHVTLVKALRTNPTITLSDTEGSSKQAKHKLTSTPSIDSLQTGSQPIRNSSHLKRTLVRDPNYVNTYTLKVGSLEKSSAEEQGCQHHQGLPMSINTELHQTESDCRWQQKMISKPLMQATAGETLVKKKVALTPPYKPPRKQDSSSSNSGEVGVYPQPTVSHKNSKPVPLPRQHKRSLAQTVLHPQHNQSASQGTSDHEYEEIDSVQCYRRRQHHPHKRHVHPFQGWQKELKQGLHREQADSGWSSGHTISDNDDI